MFGIWMVAIGTLGMFGASAHAAPPALAPVKPLMTCEAVASLDLSQQAGAPTKITSASIVQAAKPYCKVLGTVSPQVNFEVRLPIAAWTQRYLQTGCGGLCGNLRINTEKAEGCAPVTNGEIVLASTDMGHANKGPGNADWGNNPQQRIDFAHRGVHVTALVAKALIKAFYGRPPRFSYFSGCSDGGREALIEAQRYPNDFDGIAAGAPALNFSVQNSFYHAWQARANTGADGKAILNAADLPVLHRAALQACDAIDGLADGQIDDPRQCKFDPAVVQCSAAATPGACLTAVQVEAVRKLYDGPRTADGRRLTVGGPQPGSELSWAGVFVPRQAGEPIFSEMIALEAMRYVLWTPNPASPFALTDLKFDAETLASLEPARQLYNADDPDLSAFRAHGGKLILWHGWSDPHISPLNTLDYYNRVGKTLTPAVRARFVRLFMLPAMYHCSSGEGPSDFPLLAALMTWVEGGAAPEVMVARQAAPGGSGLPRRADGPQPDGASPAASPPPPLRTRPIYHYPTVARYTGKGSVDDALNFKPFVPTAACPGPYACRPPL